MPKGGNVPGPTGTIEYASVDPVIGGEVTVTTTESGLKGGEYPMVYLACTAEDGTTVYGELAHPDAVFVLGGGSSPWITPPTPEQPNPYYRVPASCRAQLFAYPNIHKSEAPILLDSEGAFEVTS